jgi:hypothetical protein
MDYSPHAGLTRTLNGWKPRTTASEGLGRLFAPTPDGQRLLRDCKLGLRKVNSSERLSWGPEALSESVRADEASRFEPNSVETAKAADVEAMWPFLLGKYLRECATTGDPKTARPATSVSAGSGSTVTGAP